MTKIETPRRRRAPLGDDGRARLEALLAASRLSAYDRGALVALGRQAGTHDRERIQAKLGGHRAQQPVTQRQANSLIAQQVRAAIDKAFADRAADGDLS